jgi:endonuclease I
MEPLRGALSSTAAHAGGAHVRAAQQVTPPEPHLYPAPTLSPPGPPADYYALAQGKQGVQLLGALHDIVRAGHVDRGYAQARDGLFGIVSDPNRNDNVVDIYTGKVLSGVYDRKSAFDKGLNTEHTSQQSGAATGIAQSDLHQLMPANIEITGRRGNEAYGVVSHQEWSSSNGPDASKQGTDAQGHEVFEPRDAVKGDIARALLYFYVRYDRSRPARYTSASFMQELPTLLKWHEQDPPDDIERKRNDDVFSIQHNRNPFIDHPEWVGQIGFTQAIAR